VDTVGDWLALVDAHWPMADASSWDAPGLHVGGRDWPVRRVLVSLDVTEAVIDEAAEVDGTLVLAHHPLLLAGVKRLTPDTAGGRLALQAAGAGVAIAAAHTNLDVAADGTGTSDPVATALGLVDVRPLATELRDSSEVKLVVFVPHDDTETVLDAVSAAGAAGAGAYERCSFRVAGTGTFTPRAGADPHIGTIDEPQEVGEDRLEVLVPRRRVGAVVAALLAAHPYEEVAYDLVPLVDGAEVGFGRIGRLPEPMTLRGVAERVATALPAPHLRTAGDRDRIVETVATVGGSGLSMARAALGAGADVFVTGDCKHHDVLDLLALGLAVVDAGHHATEVAALPAFQAALQRDATGRGLQAPVLVSTVDTDPWS
jgi:dinuclear metal center YbgI/SA1388 family protein